MTPTRTVPASTHQQHRNAPTGRDVTSGDVTHRSPGRSDTDDHQARNLDAMPRAATSAPVTTPAAVDTTPAALTIVEPSPPLVDGELLTAAEVAELLRVDVYSVRRWTRRGELTAYKIGRELRIPTGAVDDFLTARRTR